MPKKKAKDRNLDPAQAAVRRNQLEEERARQEQNHQRFAARCDLAGQLYNLGSNAYARRSMQKARDSASAAAAGSAAGSAAGAAAGASLPTIVVPDDVENVVDAIESAVKAGAEGGVAARWISSVEVDRPERLEKKHAQSGFLPSPQSAVTSSMGAAGAASNMGLFDVDGIGVDDFADLQALEKERLVSLLQTKWHQISMQNQSLRSEALAYAKENEKLLTENEELKEDEERCSKRIDDLRAKEETMQHAMESLYVSNCATLLGAGIPREQIDDHFQSWFNAQNPARYRADPGHIAWVRLIHLLTWTTHGCVKIQLITERMLDFYEEEASMIDACDNAYDDVHAILLRAKQVAAEQQLEMQNLKEENAKLKLVHDNHQRQCAELADATKQANDWAQKLKQLSDVDCFQPRIDAAVAAAVAAEKATLEQQHSTEISQRTARLKYQLEQQHAFEKAIAEEAHRQTMENMQEQALQNIENLQQHYCEYLEKAQEELAELKSSSAQAMARSAAVIKEKTERFKEIETKRLKEMDVIKEKMQEQQAEIDAIKQAKIDAIEQHEAESECVICLEAAPTHALVMCGHQIYCDACAVDIKDSKCPLCSTSFDREKVGHVVKIYK